MQKPPQKRKRREKRPRFDASVVFKVVREDLEFDVEREVVQYRAHKGEAGNRRPVGLQPRKDLAVYFV